MVTKIDHRLIFHHNHSFIDDSLIVSLRSSTFPHTGYMPILDVYYNTSTYIRSTYVYLPTEYPKQQQIKIASKIITQNYVQQINEQPEPYKQYLSNAVSLSKYLHQT